MAPAHQSLDALDPSRLHVHFRVIVQLEFVLLDCAAKARDQRGALDSARVEVWNVEAEHIPSALLRLVHGSGGALDERFR